jgi:hypothetical protein
MYYVPWYPLYTYMSQPYSDMAPTLLSALSTRNEAWTIKVKVLRIWDSINLSNNEVISVDMILAEKKVWILPLFELNSSRNLLLSNIDIYIFLHREIQSMLLLETNCSASSSQKLKKIPSTYSSPSKFRSTTAIVLWRTIWKSILFLIQ